MDQEKQKDDVCFESSEHASVSIDARNVDWSSGDEAAIRRKFDFTILPLVTVLYMLCAIDR